MRTNYDTVAPTYDSQPHRVRTPDDNLAALRRVRRADPLRALDLGCGTGNQLIANQRLRVPQIGVDASFGMLAVAHHKAPTLPWVQGSGHRLPFPKQSFDYISSQFMFHHVTHKADLLLEVARVIREYGWFVYHNVAPEEIPDWIYYHYFPELPAIDQRDFWPVHRLLDALHQLRFRAEAEYDHQYRQQDLAEFAQQLSRRDVNSQIGALTDAQYQAGLARLHADLAAGLTHRPHHICLVTIRAQRRRW